MALLWTVWQMFVFIFSGPKKWLYVVLHKKKQDKSEK